MKKRLLILLLCLGLVIATALPAMASDFTDVKDPSWYSKAVDYAVEHGYMAGMGNQKFSPNTLITRAQLTQILYAAENKPAVTDRGSFRDVEATGKWYSDAVYWGASNAIVAGYPDKTFRPNQAVTREQLVSVLFKYAVYKEKADADQAPSSDWSKFSDADQVAAYAKPGMSWAVMNGIISGTNIGLEPKSYATRAQMAVIIQALMEKVILAPDQPDESDPAPPSDEPSGDKTDPDSSDSQDTTPDDPADPDDGSSQDKDKDESDSSSQDDPAPSGNPDDSTPLTPADSGSSTAPSSGSSTAGPSSSGNNNELPVIPV